MSRRQREPIPDYVWQVLADPKYADQLREIDEATTDESAGKGQALCAALAADDNYEVPEGFGQAPAAGSGEFKKHLAITAAYGKRELLRHQAKHGRDGFQFVLDTIFAFNSDQEKLDWLSQPLIEGKNLLHIYAEAGLLADFLSDGTLSPFGSDFFRHFPTQFILSALAGTDAQQRTPLHYAASRGTNNDVNFILVRMEEYACTLESAGDVDTRNDDVAADAVGSAAASADGDGGATGNTYVLQNAAARAVQARIQAAAHLKLLEPGARGFDFAFHAALAAPDSRAGSVDVDPSTSAILALDIDLDINATDADGNTAYHLAALGAHREVVVRLEAESTLDRTITNNAGKLADQMRPVNLFGGSLFAPANPLQARQAAFARMVDASNVVGIDRLYGEGVNVTPALAALIVTGDSKLAERVNAVYELFHIATRIRAKMQPSEGHQDNAEAKAQYDFVMDVLAGALQIPEDTQVTCVSPADVFSNPTLMPIVLRYTEDCEGMHHAGFKALYSVFEKIIGAEKSDSGAAGDDSAADPSATAAAPDQTPVDVLITKALPKPGGDPGFCG